VAGQEKYLSFSWTGEQSESFTVDVDLGEAKNFTNFNIEQSNCTGTIFFKFYPSTSIVNTSYNI
jgi:hypothetical protein